MQILDRAIGELVTERVVEAPPSLTLREAAKQLDEEAVGALLVRDPRGLLGILTERDLVRALADDADPDEDRISDQLTEDLLVVGYTTTLLEALQQMRANAIRHLVVRPLEGHGIAGVVSMRAVIEAMMGSVLESPPPTVLVRS